MKLTVAYLKSVTQGLPDFPERTSAIEMWCFSSVVPVALLQGHTRIAIRHHRGDLRGSGVRQVPLLLHHQVRRGSAERILLLLGREQLLVQYSVPHRRLVPRPDCCSAMTAFKTSTCA